MRLPSSCLPATAVALIGLALASPAPAQPPRDPPTGRVTQPLITTAPVIAAEEQERLGLVAVQRAGFLPHCSGVMLTNSWVATAAHCVVTQVDRAVPSGLQVTTAWQQSAGAPRAGSQTVAAAAIYTAWGSRTARPGTTHDIALVRLAAPIRVNGWPAGFSNTIDPVGVADLVGASLRVYGRGINQWAGVNTANQPVMSQGDGLYRGDSFTVTGVNGPLGGFVNQIEFATSATRSVMGGDSGGPSFRVGADGVWRVVGVHAICGGLSCLSDQTCPGPGGTAVSCFPAQRCPDPADGSQWRWVTGITSCADAPLVAVRGAVTELIEQEWDPTSAVQALRVAHSEGDIERDMRLGPLDGLSWGYVQRAVQKMCVNRGFVAGVATGQHVAGTTYDIVCFSGAAGRRFDIGAAAGGPWAFTDPDQVGWAQANRSAAEICRASDPSSPGGFHTGFMVPASGLAGLQLGVFCLNATGGAWGDAQASTLGAAADLNTATWAAASRAASERCRFLGHTAGGFLNGHEGPSVRGTVCLGQATVPLSRPRPGG